MKFSIKNMKFSVKNMKFSIKNTKFSVYERRKKRFLLIFVTEFSNHMYRKNAVFNGIQKHMKPLWDISYINRKMCLHHWQNLIY